MTDINAREEILKARLAELDGRLHRIEHHLEQPPNPDWEDNAIEKQWLAVHNRARSVFRQPLCSQLQWPALVGRGDTPGRAGIHCRLAVPGGCILEIPGLIGA